jgi:hypothetical protein
MICRTSFGDFGRGPLSPFAGQGDEARAPSVLFLEAPATIAAGAGAGKGIRQKGEALRREPRISASRCRFARDVHPGVCQLPE